MLRHSLMLGFACAALAACGVEQDANKSGGNAAAGNAAAETSATIGDALAGSADHSSFIQVLQSAGLIETLRGAGPSTVFAPTNAAFEAIPEDARRAWRSRTPSACRPGSSATCSGPS